MGLRRRLRLLVHLSAASLLALAAIEADALLGKPPDWGPAQSFVLALGIALGLVGLLPDIGPVSQAAASLCLGVLGVLAVLAFSEALFRGIGFDFLDEEGAWRRTPPYYRQPTIPTGEVFFRRPGPETWTGQVIRTELTRLGVEPNPYADEPVVTIRYSANGFRNREDIKHWRIAVAGDSFTELGYLPERDLFTRILAQLLGVEVLNLGTSYTGPLTQFSYLRDYGVSSGTRDALIVFFEGNDVEDLATEYGALVRWRHGGPRPYREFRRQASLMRAVYQRLSAFAAPKGRSVNASFVSRDGPVPVTVTYTPPEWNEISAQSKHQLNDFLQQYASFGRNRDLRVWLVYMPSKRRVLHGFLEFLNSASEKLRTWTPSDLPDFMADLCRANGVAFIDLTPALTDETRRTRELLYNAVYDTHLNARGSRVVAERLALHLKEAWAVRRGGGFQQ